ncbi:MAG: ACP S-malonyltransferase [candidate division KSB1 bacterium]|nr:ACP S-malonyltransferase [candidate division KSB1 bacterium]
MPQVAFLYPGQASQYVGMGKDLYNKFALAKEIFAIANRQMGFDLSAVCFEGPEEQLKQTRITQPAIFVHSVLVTRLLAQKNIIPDMAAGHSLGEYSALVAADAMSFEDGLTVVKHRGELMQEAGEKQPGTMAAIVGLPYDQVVTICKQAAGAGVVTAANINSPLQIVISGSLDGVAAAVQLAKEQGAKKTIPLVVSGAFHSPLMASAQEELKRILEKIEIRSARFPVFANVTARPVTRPEEIRTLLYQQLTQPVRWVETIENMIAAGATDFYEVGPGDVLAGLNKRINRNFVVQTKGKLDEIE